MYIEPIEVKFEYQRWCVKLLMKLFSLQNIHIKKYLHNKSVGILPYQHNIYDKYFLTIPSEVQYLVRLQIMLLCNLVDMCTIPVV
jgi:hypothetical protein